MRIIIREIIKLNYTTDIKMYLFRLKMYNYKSFLDLFKEHKTSNWSSHVC